MIHHGRTILYAAGFLAIAFAGTACTRSVTAPQPATPAAARGDEGQDLVGQEVTARVERLEYKAHTENLSDGTVIVSHVIWLGVGKPRMLPSMVAAISQSLPAIGDRRIQLGDVVTFVLPKNWQSGDIELSALRDLRFRD